MSAEHLENELTAVSWVLLVMANAGNTNSPRFAELSDRARALREAIETKEAAA